jgi:hypothetical protein
MLENTVARVKEGREKEEEVDAGAHDLISPMSLLSSKASSPNRTETVRLRNAKLARRFEEEEDDDYEEEEEYGIWIPRVPSAPDERGGSDMEATQKGARAAAEDEMGAAECATSGDRGEGTALAALKAANSGLYKITKGDLTEVKGFLERRAERRPPLVQTTMEAVCILLGKKPDCDSSKKLLGDPDFLQQLVDYDKDNIDPKRIKALQRYISMENFTPEEVGNVSAPAKGGGLGGGGCCGVLCMWARAMDMYARVAKEKTRPAAAKDAPRHGKSGDGANRAISTCNGQSNGQSNGPLLLSPATGVPADADNATLCQHALQQAQYGLKLVSTKGLTELALSSVVTSATPATGALQRRVCLQGLPSHVPRQAHEPENSPYSDFI